MFVFPNSLTSPPGSGCHIFPPETMVGTLAVQVGLGGDKVRFKAGLCLLSYPILLVVPYQDVECGEPDKVKVPDGRLRVVARRVLSFGAYKANTLHEPLVI